MSELIGCNDNITEPNKYMPTPAEEKLLSVLLNPDNLGLSVVEKCQLAKISRTTYYEIMKRPEFAKLQNNLAVSLIRDKISDVLQATVNSAIKGGSRGYQDRRMLLELYGIAVKADDNRITIINIGE